MSTTRAEALAGGGGAVTEDGLLGGRVRLLQPARGYRVAVDPVLLAAAVDPPEGARVVDLGCGVGAIGLCLLARRPDLTVTGIERDAATADLARRNAALNGVADRLRVIEADATDIAVADIALADLVVCNPPYLEPSRADPPPDPARAAAHVEGAAVSAWVAAAGRRLKPRGHLAMVHRADRLADLLAALAPGWGGIVVHPLWPKPGRPAKRLLLGARRGVAAPLSLGPGAVLHEPDGIFAPAVAAALSGSALRLDPPLAGGGLGKPARNPR